VTCAANVVMIGTAYERYGPAAHSAAKRPQGCAREPGRVDLLGPLRIAKIGRTLQVVSASVPFSDPGPGPRGCGECSMNLRRVDITHEKLMIKTV